MKNVSIGEIKDAEVLELVSHALSLYGIPHTQSDADADIIITDTSPTAPITAEVIKVTSPVDIARLMRSLIDSLTSGDGRSERQTVKLSEEKMTVTYKGEEIALTETEFALFSYLYSRRGMSVSREQIAEHVWNSSKDTNLIDVYISYLRKKCKDIMPPSLILSVRGKGYMMNL